jgi:hypothetical protein
MEEPTIDSSTSADAAEAADNISTLSDYNKIRDALIVDSAESRFVDEVRPFEPEPIPKEVPPEEDVQAAPKEKTPPRAAKNKTTKQRIDKVVWEREEARKEANSLREQLSSLQSATPPAPDKAVQSVPASKEAATVDNGPSESDYQEYGDFIAAKARWAARQEVGEAIAYANNYREQETIKSQQEERASNFANKLESSTSDDPDFLTRINPEVLNLRPAMSLQEGETPDGGTAIADLLVDSESPKQMMEYLSSNEDDFRRISALHPMLAMRELGRIEAGFGAAPNGPAPRLVRSQAQPPIRPVGSSANTVARHREPSDISSVAEWRVARERLLHNR